MRAGRLDRRITIQRKTVTQSGSGEQVEVWTNLVDRRPASKAPVRGDEKFTGEQKVGEEQVEFRIRWSSIVSDLTPLDRLIYPALTVAESASDPPDVPLLGRVYDILAIHEIGRREGLQIITRRRADVTT